MTAFAWVLDQGLTVLGARSFDDGQRHACEVEAAAAVAASYELPYQTLALAPICGSSLTDLGGIPQSRGLRALTETVAPTYV